MPNHAKYPYDEVTRIAGDDATYGGRGAEEPAITGDSNKGRIVGILLFVFIPDLRKAKART